MSYVIILKEENHNFINNLPIYKHTHIYNNKIFWCWLQGEKTIPKLASACLNSVKKNCKNHEILIITEENMKKYVNIPKFILRKYKNGEISKAHFSDLLRLELLIKYGGTWIDASVLLTGYEPKFFNKDLFYFTIINKKYMKGSNWFITSEKDSPVLKTTRDLLYHFWKYNSKIKEYLIFYIFFTFACEKYSDDCKNVEIHSVEISKLFQRQLSKPFNESLYNYIISKTTVHKLVARMNKKSNRELFYQHFIKLYS